MTSILDSLPDKSYTTAADEIRDRLSQQISSIATLIYVRKMRSGVPDTTKLVLQSLSQSEDKGSLQQQEQAEGTQDKSNVSYVRRYSQQQGENLDDTFDTNKILQKFTDSLSLTAQQSRLLGKDPTEVNSSMDNSPAKTETGQRSLACITTRHQSSPDLASLAKERQVEMQTDTPSSPVKKANRGFISGYLTRKQSLTSIEPIPEKAIVAREAGDGGRQAVLVSPSSSSVDPIPQSQTIDKVDGPIISNSYGQASGGFGLLSRTRKFGAWLAKTTEGDKIEVTKTDLNTVAPTSF